jgi:hypothetical protein
MGNFPQKWLSQSMIGTLLAAGISAGAKGPNKPQFTPPAGLPLSNRSLPPNAQQWYHAVATPDQYPSTTEDRPVTIQQTDIHPMFKQLMSQYVTHFWSVQWKMLLNAVNITEENLPVLPKYMVSGRNTLTLLGNARDVFVARQEEGMHQQLTLRIRLHRICAKSCPAG